MILRPIAPLTAAERLGPKGPWTYVVTTWAFKGLLYHVFWGLYICLYMYVCMYAIVVLGPFETVDAACMRPSPQEVLLLEKARAA